VKFVFAAAALVAGMAAAMFLSARQESQTWDEATHLAAGYSYWKTGNFQLNVEHPPLVKRLCALPLLLMNLELPLDGPGWREPDQVKFGREFVYHNRLPADVLLFAGRSMAILLTLAFGAVMALWMRARHGPAASLIALSLFAFDPNLIAHGRYVTTDLALTAFYFLTCALWSDWLTRGGRLRLAAVGLSLGLALASKFSALPLVPVLALCAIAPANLRRQLRYAAGWLAACAIAAVVLASMYWPVMPSRDHPYIKGLLTVVEHNAGGHISYLLGQTAQTGWWYYFPVAIAVKWTVASLALVAGALCFVRRGLVLAIAAAALLAAAMTSGLNIGLRHVLPAFPLLYALAGIGAAHVSRKWKPAAAVVAVLLVAHAAESWSVYPHYLAFFNRAAGGPEQGPRYLLDSNIDWGQDIKKLSVWLSERNVEQVCISYFGNTPFRYYGIGEQELPGTGDSEERTKLDCVAAVSVTELMGVYSDPQKYAWLRARQPDARIGYSIYIYDLRKKPAASMPWRGFPSMAGKLPAPSRVSARSTHHEWHWL
jgi:hypothetical protein